MTPRSESYTMQDEVRATGHALVAQFRYIYARAVVDSTTIFSP